MPYKYVITPKLRGKATQENPSGWRVIEGHTLGAKRAAIRAVRNRLREFARLTGTRDFRGEVRDMTTGKLVYQAHVASDQSPQRAGRANLIVEEL